MIVVSAHHTVYTHMIGVEFANCEVRSNVYDDSSYKYCEYARKNTNTGCTTKYARENTNTNARTLTAPCTCKHTLAALHFVYKVVEMTLAPEIEGGAWQDRWTVADSNGEMVRHAQFIRSPVH